MARGPIPWGAVVLLIATQSAFADHSLEYLYIEANSGTSSGGHVAVKLDETVYHFQNKDGLILLQRDGWPRFQHLYADLDNRDIHVARISIPDSIQIEVKRHLDLSHLQQKAWLDRIASLDRDLQLLEAQAQKHAFTVPGAGFFVEAKTLQPHQNPIRDTLAAHETPKTLQDRLQSIIQKREELEYTPPQITPESFNPTSFPRSYADEWTDLVQGEIALEFVLGRKQFNPNILLDGGALPVHVAQENCSGIHWLSGYQGNLERAIVQLVQHPYPGSGLPLLRALARLEAVKRSLEQGRLLFPSPGVTSTPLAPLKDDYLQRPQNQLEVEFRHHLEELSNLTFCTAEADDLSYHKLELAALDLKETAEANRQAIPVRFDHEPDLPNAPSPLNAQQMGGRRIPQQADLESALNARTSLHNQIIERMHYNLITRNCVTELIRAINLGFENDVEPPAFKGHIDPLRSQSFVPFRFFELVLQQYPVETTSTIPSFRHRRLAELKVQIESPWLDLLESNTLTASIYHRRDEDGVFLFFTDETMWSRPLLGVANLGAAIGAMALGTAEIPFDQGRLLEAGARGALFSLPEIALWNIRKGSYTEAILRN